MVEVLPIFKSHYSIGRSILTLKHPDNMIENGPDSIIDICLQNKFNELVLVDDNMSGFLEAYTITRDLGISLKFGLRISVTADHEDKSNDSLTKTCKYIIFPKNLNGCERLIKIFSHAAKEGFYYVPRTDFKSIKSFWSEDDLALVVPFYDSFIFYNDIYGYNCVPEIDFTNPKFILESHSLPFDDLIRKKVDFYTKNKYDTQEAKSIYYNLRKDFKSYLTFRCINNRSTLEKPNLNHMCGDTFSFEEWREQNGTV